MKLVAWTLSGQKLDADMAAEIHSPGDIYIDQKTGKYVQLHICQSMRNHFEFMRNQEQVK